VLIHRERTHINGTLFVSRTFFVSSTDNPFFHTQPTLTNRTDCTSLSTLQIEETDVLNKKFRLTDSQSGSPVDYYPVVADPIVERKSEVGLFGGDCRVVLPGVVAMDFKTIHTHRCFGRNRAPRSDNNHLILAALISTVQQCERGSYFASLYYLSQIFYRRRRTKGSLT